MVRRCDPNMHRPTRADLSRTRRANGQTPGQVHVEGPSVAETERGFAQAYRPVWGGKMARPRGRSRVNIAESRKHGYQPTTPLHPEVLLSTRESGAPRKAGVVSEEIEGASNRPAVHGPCSARPSIFCE
eukprot:gene14207-biopygen17090